MYAVSRCAACTGYAYGSPHTDQYCVSQRYSTVSDYTLHPLQPYRLRLRPNPKAVDQSTSDHAAECTSPLLSHSCDHLRLLRFERMDSPCPRHLGAGGCCPCYLFAAFEPCPLHAHHPPPPPPGHESDLEEYSLSGSPRCSPRDHVCRMCRGLALHVPPSLYRLTSTHPNRPSWHVGVGLSGTYAEIKKASSWPKLLRFCSKSILVTHTVRADRIPLLCIPC